MRQITVLLACFLFIKSIAFSQCIEKEKIVYGGDYGFVDYIHLCPTYSFAFGGNKSKNWNVLNDPIDIKQAPVNALLFKKKVETAIKNFAGDDFCSNLKFHDVEVVYPERLNFFKTMGRQDVTLEHYKAKYFYYYRFEPDSVAAYLVGIAVDKTGKILSPFVFPSRKTYKGINKSFTYCKLIQLAKTKQKDIEPIKSISLEFDKESKRFIWMVTQEIVNSHEGVNYFNQVSIDAEDLSKIKTIKGETYIVY